MTKRLFCFGLGFSALTLVRQLSAQGWQVAGTVRSSDKADKLARQGIEAFLFDGTAPMADVAQALKGVTHILSSIPPQEDDDPVMRHHGADLVEQSSIEWAGYLSTTGVYGDHDGAWVDEDTPLTPSGARGQARKNAEAAWLDAFRNDGLPVHIFRLAGIYGPGRSALDSLRSGKARRIDKPGQVFSRIHVEDIAHVLAASMANPSPGTAYNVCDDDPAPPQDVIAFAADLLGVDPPPLIPFDEADLSPMARSFYADNKRVRNDKIKNDLGVSLQYPTYREGLRAQAEKPRP